MEEINEAENVIHVNRVCDKPFIAGYFNLAKNHIEDLERAVKEHFPIQQEDNKKEQSKKTSEEEEKEENKKEKEEKEKKRKLLVNLFAVTNFDVMSETDFQARLDFVSSYFRAANLVKQYCKKDNNDILDRKKFVDNLTNLIDLLGDCRNYYTHYCHSKIEITKEVKELLDAMFISSALDVKKTRLKGDQARRVIKESFKDELDGLISAQKEYLRQKKVENHKISLDDISVENSTLNSLFYRLVNKKEINNGVDYEINKNYALFEQDETSKKWKFTDDGLAFFLGLFLTKKEGAEFRSRIRGFKKTDNLTYNVTHWVFSYPALRAVDNNFETTFSKDAFVFQMIDELTKVPDELYRNLSPEKQDDFLMDMNTFVKEGTKNVSGGAEENTVVNPVLRKRYEDKFNYFALRYLDEFAGLTKIRFQVYVGNYAHDSREKKIGPLNVYTERVCREKIKTFGHLSELKKLKTNYFENEETNDNLNEPGWSRFPNPSYNIENGNILLEININNVYIKNKINDAQQVLKNSGAGEWNARKEGKASKDKIVSDMQKKELETNTDNKLPPLIAQMSLNELPAMLYALLVNKEKPYGVEKRIIEAYQKHFKAIEKHEGKHLPHALIHPKGTDLNSAKLKYDIQLVIDDTIQRMEAFQKRKEEMEQKKGLSRHFFKAKELGEAVTFLCKDLLRFMPVTYRKEWKGYMHSEFQALLPHYDINREEVKSLLFSCWDERKNPGNVYEKVCALFRTKRFEDLYDQYLVFRKTYMENLLTGMESAGGIARLRKKLFKDEGVWNYFNKRLYERDNEGLLTSRFLARPMVLPRGLFDDKPTFIKGTDPEKNPERFADWYVYPYDKECGVQKFYDYTNDTNCFKASYAEYKKESEGIQRNKYNFSEEQQKELFKKKQLTAIKNVKRRDGILYLIVKQMLESMDVHDFKPKLNDFYLTPEERKEKEKTALLQKDRQPGDKSENIVKDTYIVDMTLPFTYSIQSNEAEKIVFQENNVKVKDHRTLFFLMREKKVKTLFSYDLRHVWNQKSMGKELFEYEQIRREGLFREIHRLEKHVLSLYNWKEGERCPDDLSKPDEKGVPNFRRFIFNPKVGFTEEVINQICKGNKTLQDFNQNPPEIKQYPKVREGFFLVFIRNKFSHNELPEIDFLKECEAYYFAKDSLETYATYYLRVAEKLIGVFVPGYAPPEI